MTDNTKGLVLHDAESDLIAQDDGTYGIVRTQEITKNFLSDLADDRAASRNAKMGDFHKVASIPTVIVEKWMREGFNIFDRNNTLQDIIRKLNSEDMGHLMATSRTVV